MDTGKYREKIKFFFKTLFIEIQDDQVATGGAALAFYLTLAILPALISCIALLAFFPLEGIQDFVFSNIKQFLPGEIGQFLISVLNEAISQKKPGLVSTGFIAALWATSSGMGAVINQLNVVYDVKNKRNLIKHRLVSIAMTILYLVLIVLASGLIVTARDSEYSLWKFFPENTPFTFVENLLSYIASYIILLLSFGLMYYVGPNTKLKFKFITPGSFAGSSILILAALVFDYYISNFASFDRTYGSIAGFIVLMLWLYIAGFVLLLGAEINSVYRNIKINENKEKA